MKYRYLLLILWLSFYNTKKSVAHDTLHNYQEEHTLYQFYFTYQAHIAFQYRNEEFNFNKYVTKELINKIKAIQNRDPDSTELLYTDPFFDAQDASLECLQTFKIEKVENEKSVYLYSCTDSYKSYSRVKVRVKKVGKDKFGDDIYKIDKIWLPYMEL